MRRRRPRARFEARLGLDLPRSRPCSLRRSRTGRGARSTATTASNERLEFLGDSVLGLVVTDYVFEHYPAAARGPARRRCGPSVVNAEVLAEVAAEHRARRRACCSARARTRRAAATKPSILADAFEAVDRRGLPRRRARRPRATSCCGCLARAHRRGRRRARRPRLQDAAAGARGAARRSAARATSRARRGPRSREALLRDGATSATSAYGEGEGGSKKQAEQAAALGRVGHGCRAGRGADAGRGGARMPELPEVEVVRRDLEREVVGKKIKAVEVDRHALGPPAPATARSSSTSLDGPQDHRRSSGAGKYLVAEARRRRRARRPPRHVGPAAAREDGAREGAEAHARRDHVHAGRPAALRRPAHVRRDVRRPQYDEHRRSRSTSSRTSASTRSRPRCRGTCSARMLAERKHEAEAAADGPEVHRRDRQHLQRRDPLRGRAPVGPHERLALAAGGPAPVPRDRSRRCRTR